jgi:hypothetical protein
MTSQHTPGPWSQGYTLTTRQTRRWSPEEIAANDARERLMVFSGFTHLDEGQGRERVALCYRAEDARLIAAAPELLEALESAADELERLMTWHGTEVRASVLRDARAAIAKARGTQ